LTERTETTLLKTRLDKMQMAKLFNSQSLVALYRKVVRSDFVRLILQYPMILMRHSPEVYLPEQRRRHKTAILDLDEASVSRLSKLPQIHRDPSTEC